MRRGAILLALMLAPTTARAGNELHPRTPVDWSGAPCMTIIDRSQSAVFPLEYAIPYEDVDVTPDEVDQSRTHQFFGFCRDHHLEEIIPSWITEADLLDADAHGLGDADVVDTELHVLDNAPHWADCWVRINPDAERRPITFAAAAEPVVWDTLALPAGAWAVEGYTYEPWANEWWPHPGVFKIIDDPDPAASGPAAALDFPEQSVEFGEQATISGCVDAMPGATMSFSWALSGFGSEPQWEVFAADVPAESGAFELTFEPPLETVSNTVLIKVDVSDPMGRSWTAHAIRYIGVTEAFGEDGCDDGGGFVSDPCETDTGESGGPDGEDWPEEESEGGDASGDSSTGEDPSARDDGGGACACSTRPTFATGLLGVGVLGVGLGLGLTGRRSSRRRSG